MAVQTFDRDADYLEWVRQHPHEFVVNTTATPSPGYMMLHRSTCNHINSAKAGKAENQFTKSGYGKWVADDVASLREWAAEHGRPAGDFNKPCDVCRPLG